MYASYNSHQILDGAALLAAESTAMALLSHLSMDELNALLNDEQKLNNLIKDLSQLKDVQMNNDRLIIQNRRLAEYNLDMEPGFVTLKSQLSSSHELIKQLTMEIGVNRNKLESLAGDQRLDTMHALCLAATAEAEESSEKLADEFCSGSIKLVDFVDRFLPMRKQTHMRRIKAEKMGELLRDRRSQHHHHLQDPVAAGAMNAVGLGAGASGVANPPYPVGAGRLMPQPILFRPY